MEKNFNWEDFRRETAARVMAAYISAPMTSHDAKYRPAQVKSCIAYTDELIKQLKEKE